MNDYRLSYKIDDEASLCTKYDQSDDDDRAFCDLSVMIKKQLRTRASGCSIIKFEKYCPYRDIWTDLKFHEDRIS